MKILAFDLETNGVPEENLDTRILEIAFATYDTDTKRVISSASALVDPFGGDLDEAIKNMPKLIVDLNGITPQMATRDGVLPDEALTGFLEAVYDADALLARNGENFDLPIIKRELRNEDIRASITMPLIDEYIDFQYPPHVRGRSLSHIAADLGFLNPFPHVALGDVITMIQCLERAGIDWDKALASSKNQYAHAIAAVDYADRALPKAAGFTWNPNAKHWIKPMRFNNDRQPLKQGTTEVADLGFSVEMTKPFNVKWSEES